MDRVHQYYDSWLSINFRMVLLKKFSHSHRITDINFHKLQIITYKILYNEDQLLSYECAHKKLMINLLARNIRVRQN
jgi:putative heme iron utilization protein